jgi:hypothetical protein
MNLRRLISLPAIALLAVHFVALAQEDDEIEYKRVSISGQFDNGQIIKGSTSYTENNIANISYNGDYFQRMGVWITQEAVVKDRLQLTVGVGGIFWYSSPQSPNQVSSRQTQFGPGISQAQGVYTFGDLENPTARLQMGFFPYKYNPDAKNLGEYLMRAGTYPGYLTTGGWSMLNSAGYMMQGLRGNAQYWDNRVNVDLLLAMERDLPPLFSLTPAVVASVTPIEGIRLGAGAAWNHGIPIKPSRETPNDPEGKNYVIKGIDSTGALIRDTTERYSFQGVKVTATASFDPKAFIPLPEAYFGAEDLKLYGEIAVLGWKNYDFMYEKRSERMPIMGGINIPTFKMLDVLSFELEYYNSRFLNSFTEPLYSSLPIWVLPDYADSSSVAQYNAAAKRDNWKWTVYGKKRITKGIDIYAQAASDHIRTFHVLEGLLPTMVPITNRNGKDWYYLIRVQFGI